MVNREYKESILQKIKAYDSALNFLSYVEILEREGLKFDLTLEMSIRQARKGDCIEVKYPDIRKV